MLSLSNFLNWVHVHISAMKLIGKLCESFPKGLDVLEHYGNYFRFRLEKEEGISIGRLFGLVEDFKDNLKIVNEYSVSQTTLEQIFQNFVN